MLCILVIYFCDSLLYEVSVQFEIYLHNLVFALVEQRFDLPIVVKCLTLFILSHEAHVRHVVQFSHLAVNIGDIVDEKFATVNLSDCLLLL